MKVRTKVKSGIVEFNPTMNVRALVLEKLTEYFPTIPVGGIVIPPAPGRVLWRALVGQVEAASPFVLQAKLTPEADIAMMAPEVAVFATPTINVHQVA